MFSNLILANPRCKSKNILIISRFAQRSKHLESVLIKRSNLSKISSILSNLKDILNIVKAKFKLC